MSLKANIISIQAVGQQLRVAFNLVPTGSYATGGDTVDFTAAGQDVNFVGLLAQIISSQAPISLDVWDAGGNIANGIFPVLGTTLANNKVKFTSAFNTELTAAAYPAAITGSKLQGEAIFQKLL